MGNVRLTAKGTVAPIVFIPLLFLLVLVVACSGQAMSRSMLNFVERRLLCFGFYDTA